MRIIGVDPGSTITGYGIVEEVNNRLCHVASGRVVSSSRMDFHQRLKRIYAELEEVIALYEPEARFRQMRTCRRCHFMNSGAIPLR